MNGNNKEALAIKERSKGNSQDKARTTIGLKKATKDRMDDRGDTWPDSHWQGQQRNRRNTEHQGKDGQEPYQQHLFKAPYQ
jgi:hypothetical protein